MKTVLYLTIVMLTVFYGCRAQSTKSEIIKIKQGSSVKIDGKIEEKEWQDASDFNLSGGGKVFFKYNGDYFYIGVRGVKDGWCQIYLSEGESTDVYVLHASSALGMSIYSLNKNQFWQPSNEFAWELRDRTINPETNKKMADYLAKNFWVANNNNMNNKNEIEFQIKRHNPATKEFRLAVEYVTGKEKQFFPAVLADDSLKSKLSDGYTPPNLKFNHNQWATVVLENYE